MAEEECPVSWQRQANNGGVAAAFAADVCFR